MAEVEVLARQTSPEIFTIYWGEQIGDIEYYVYIDGLLVGKTTDSSFEVRVEENESVVVQVFDDEEDDPDYAISGHVTIGWESFIGATRYVVKEFIGGEWTEIATILDDGRFYYSWRSRFLEDSTTHQFLVTHIDDSGIEGAPLYLRCVMARHPDVPAFSVTYDTETQKATVHV